MAESIFLPLRPSIVASSKDSLEFRIAQINKQKGAFRHVTETSLLEEIRNDAQSDSDVEMDSEGSEDALKPKDRQALLWKGREAMLQQIDHARNETLTALDFISAMLSKQVIAAQSSMSPVLKEAVPVGSLECRTVKFVPVSAAEKRKLDMTRHGWKMASFASAAEKIAAAGTRLQEEAERECRYWEQISALKAEGWAVSRLPRDSRTVGVHFGFTEAAPAFRNRGFAILRRGPNGDICLDRSVVSPRQRVLAVTVSRGGRESGSSTIKHEQVTEDSPIEHQVLRAQKTLSEEELFHEISREGRLLANQGVEMSSKSVKFDFGSNVGSKFDVQIRLLDPEIEAPPSNVNALAEDIANEIALSLRILLAHAHQQNYRRRSNAPFPMTLRAKATPEYALLRPVMSQLQHYSHLDFLRSFTNSVLPPLSKAGLDLPVKLRPFIHWNTPTSLMASSLQASELLEPLIAPLESTMTLELPTKRTLELTVRTFVGHPVFGTEFSIRPLNYGNKNLISPRLENVADVEKYVCHMIMVDLTAFIEGLHPITEKDEQSDGGGGGGMVLGGQNWWRITDLHHGELSRQQLPNSVEKLQVKVWRDRVGLRHVSKTVSRKSADIVPYIWEADKSWKTTALNGQEDTSGLHVSELVTRSVRGKTSDT